MASDLWKDIRAGRVPEDRGPLFFASEIPLPGLIQLGVIDGDWKLVQIVRERQTQMQTRSMLFRIRDDPNEENDVAAEHPEVVERLTAAIGSWRSQHPMAGTRGTLVPHPGWVPARDWADAVQPAEKLQERWVNELPFSRQLIEASAERGVLVDEETKQKLYRAEEARRRAMQSESN